MSRRKGTSRAPPDLIIAASLWRSGKLFGKLDAVAVGVVDIEHAHLAVQLQHRADLDALGAEAVCFGLDVRHVHGRYSGLALGLALRDRDIHRAALQRRPAACLVEVGLPEAELLGVERAAGFEISYSVPDLDRAHSIRPGSSRNALTVRR